MLFKSQNDSEIIHQILLGSTILLFVESEFDKRNCCISMSTNVDMAVEMKPMERSGNLSLWTVGILKQAGKQMRSRHRVFFGIDSNNHMYHVKFEPDDCFCHCHDTSMLITREQVNV